MFAPKGSAVRIVAVCSAISTATNFQEAYSNSYPNTAILTFRDYVNNSYIDRGVDGGKQGLTDSMFTWIWSAILNVWFLGYLCGAFLTPYFADTYGRKRSLLMANLLSVVGALLSTFAVVYPWPELLFVGRIAASIASGTSFGTLILFIQETTPTELRGMTSFLSETVFLAVNVIGMGFGMDVVFGKNLPLLIGIGLVPTVISVLIVIPAAETPKFLLINRNNRAAAMKALIYYRGDSPHNEEVIRDILKENDGGHGLPLRKALLKVFRTPHLRQAFILGVLIVQIVVGIWPIIYLSTDFLSAHFSPTLAQIGSFAFILFNFIASIPGMFAVEHFGRRSMLISFGILNTVCLSAYCLFDRLSFYVHPDFKYGCLIALIAYGTSYGAALGPIAWFITSELVPQRFRSLIQSMVFCFNTVMNFTFSFVTLPVYRAINVWGFIPLFIIPSTLCLIYIYKYLPETRGREIYEIVEKLKGSSGKASMCCGADSDHSSSSPSPSPNAVHPAVESKAKANSTSNSNSTEIPSKDIFALEVGDKCCKNSTVLSELV